MLCVCVSLFQDECVLEAAVQERAQVLFQVLLQYVTDLMVWEEGDKLPEEMEPRSAKLDSLNNSLAEIRCSFIFPELHKCYLYTKFVNKYTACLLMF